MVAMMVYTIIVDRIQWIMDALAHGDRCNEMFIQRVNAELQIFGLVAISLFIGQNLMGTMPHDTFAFFEFVDIFVSMGACSLILVGVLLYCMRRLMESQWKDYHSNHDDFHVHAKNDSAHVHSVSQGSLDFYVMAAHFREDHHLGHDFDFFLYMRETLSDQICELINVTWVTWILCLLVSLVALGIVDLGDTLNTWDAERKVLGFTLACWITTALELLIVLFLRRKYMILRQHLGTHSRKHMEECLNKAKESQ